MTSDGSAYSRFQRAIRARNLPLIHATAAELGWVALRDALAILLVIDDRDEERFDRAAVRWAGRLATEEPGITLEELAGAIVSLHALPDETRSGRFSRSPPALCAQPHCSPQPQRSGGVNTQVHVGRRSGRRPRGSRLLPDTSFESFMAGSG